MKRVITGTFKGTDGSVGYRTGKYYGLVVEYKINPIRRLLNRWPADWEVIVTGPFFCPYSSWGALRQNWDIDGGLGQERL